MLLLGAALPAAQALEAGAAKVDISPPLDTPLNGYGDRMGRGAMEHHDPIWVRALYLDNGETNLFLVSADLCVINRELRAKVLEMAPAHVPAERIILVATHNHSGQGAMMRGLLFRAVSGRFMPEILELTARGFVEAMNKAYATRKRAVIGYGAFEQDDLSVNRREEDGPIDSQVGVIRVEDPDGAPLAIIANLAAHPTTIGGKDRLTISAGYPGFYYDELEALAGQQCVAMFLNGAEGNQRCANPEDLEGWDRTASIGRLLAERVMEHCESIVCAEASLDVGYTPMDLPATIGSSFLPSSTVLQTLEVNDLLMTFYPGEPCVELGLRMRERALERGYGNQFTVGLGNDILLYFVPWQYYSKLYYETAMNFYGPFIEDVFYRGFSKLMTKGEPVAPLPTPPAPEVQQAGGGRIVYLEGSAHERGYQRGLAFKDEIVQAYQGRIVAACDSGELIPDTGLWKSAPGFINLTPLALPVLAVSVRPMLAGLAEDQLRELNGAARAAGLPFDAVWLAQCARIITAREPGDGLYRAPFCTMFAAVEERAGADEVLVGRNFDWAGEDVPVAAVHTSATGTRWFQAGFGWSTGAFTAMNDNGLVLCAERVEALGKPSLDGPPIEMVLRRIIETESVSVLAAKQLEAAEHLAGYQVLIADPDTLRARVIELGSSAETRWPSSGFLLGSDPEDEHIGEAAKVRYGRVLELLGEERIISTGEIKETLADRVSEAGGPDCIFNEMTQYSVVFEPKALKVHIAFTATGGGIGEYTTISLAPETES